METAESESQTMLRLRRSSDGAHFLVGGGGNH